jgi:uncharacterized protein (DUF983 family)
MDEIEKQRQRMKNFALFDMALTDEEMKRPIPKWLLVVIWLAGAIAVALLVLRFTT